MTELFGPGGGPIAHQVTALTAATEENAAGPELIWELVAGITQAGAGSPACIRAAWLAEPGRPPATVSPSTAGPRMPSGKWRAAVREGSG
jgi:hypothetical protein